ncbi:unnamed protein product [Arctia plantaginis]|uniref:Uncharacterized protein n=1 Tax=Arctia plantaginis TaxID=874455 RepID=A0A8S0YRE5_ARCPL|nr:unnamed protein product [Arctia plantaginis]CAB3261477.1 unnamed protein product [Arctia plantaginis]
MVLQIVTAVSKKVLRLTVCVTRTGVRSVRRGAVVGLSRMSRPVTDKHVVCTGALPTISSVESIIDGNGMPPTIDAIDVVHTLRNTA